MSTIDHISFSQLTKMAECGEMYRRAYVLEERGTPSVPMLAGSAIHHGIEMFELSSLGQGMTAHERIFTLRHAEGHELIVREAKAHIRKFLDMHSLAPTDLLHYGRQTLAVYQKKKLPDMAGAFLARRKQDVENHYAIPFPTVAEAVERDFEFEIAGTRLVGTVDHLLLDRVGDLVLRDYKTGARKLADAWQLEIYRWLVKQATGLDAAYGQVNYIGARAGTEIVRWNLNDDAVEEMLVRLVRQIELEQFPVTGPFRDVCEMCPYTDCKWGGARLRGVS